MAVLLQPAPDVRRQRQRYIGSGGIDVAIGGGAGLFAGAPAQRAGQARGQAGGHNFGQYKNGMTCPALGAAPGSHNFKLNICKLGERWEIG